MKAKHFLKLALVLPVALLLMSHAVWIESVYKGVEGDEVIVNLYFGEFEKALREKGEAITSMADFKALYIYENKQPTPIKLEKTNASMHGHFTATGSGFYQILAVNDEREVQDWTKHGMGILRPIEYQRSSFTAFSEKKTEDIVPLPYFYLDILPNYILNHNEEVCSIFNKGQIITGRIYLNKKPYANADMQVYEPSKKIKKIKSDPSGNFSFSATTTGTFLITSALNDSTAGTFKGKEYKMVRHHASTTVNVE